MKKTLTAAIASLALLTAACGGDDGGGDQSKVADEMLEMADAEGIALEEDCVREVAAKLSDDDAAALLKSLGTDEEPDISADADALAEEMFGCIETDALVDQMMEQIGNQPGMDQDCVREVLDGLSTDDLSEIANSSGDMSSDVMGDLMNDIIPCMSAGG
ncbi:MAG: hypothetical protein ACK5CE_14560 [Actinomycetes bacterium]|uniref:Unannotated protein n=1 Tax=freshwater metagenome TaxID=449393 RepID=A0A6J6BKI9_9ZZZZ|nr:hypothetical protein [Actinomycetota bacterium]